jgi:hypothetical protein
LDVFTSPIIRTHEVGDSRQLVQPASSPDKDWTADIPISPRADTDFLADGQLIEELVELSAGRIRADIVHEPLAALGLDGTERTTRRAVQLAKKSHHVLGLDLSRR